MIIVIIKKVMRRCMFMSKKKYQCQATYSNELQRQTDIYTAWITEKESNGSTKEISGIHKCGPLITVVPFGGYHKWDQLYQNVDYIEEATDIFDFASMAGDYIAYVNSAGELVPEALSTIENILNYDLIYSDEDCVLIENNMRHTPFFKPDWSPDTLFSFFYIGNFFIIKKEAIKNVPLLDAGSEAVRLYDMLIKVSENSPKVLHIPQILYHKNTNMSTEKITVDSLINMNEEEEICKIKEIAFERRKTNENRANDGETLISLVILSKDNLSSLKLCTQSIDIKSKYNKVEIIIVDNGSKEDNKREIEKYARESAYQYIYQPMAFNYSMMCNIGAKAANGEFLLFMNDDIEVSDPMFIYKMLRYATMSHVGAVGAKLLYPGTDIIQHIGITNQACGPTHKLSSFSDSSSYYFGRNKKNYNVIAVTGACMMISREKYFQVGGFSDKMGVSYNDVDLCVSLYEAGYYNVICNDTLLYHYESQTRGYDQWDQDKYARLLEERKKFYARHCWLGKTDPFYNVNLIGDTLDYRPNVEYDYESRAYFNAYSVIARTKLPRQTTPKKLQWNLERKDYIRGIQAEDSDYFYFEGWSLLMNTDNVYFARYLLLIPQVGDVLQIEVSDKHRVDVMKVFPDARSGELAGFVCKIKSELIDESVVYQTALLVRSKISFQKYFVIGEQYGPKRRI